MKAKNVRIKTKRNRGRITIIVVINGERVLSQSWLK